MWQPRYKWRTTTDFTVACHDPGLLSSSAGTGLWPIRWLFSASARAALQAAVHCFGSVAVAAEAIGYCSVRCRQQARRQQCREANRRHQQSPGGRLDHRDRQRAYRRRPERVTDQGRREDRIFVSMAAVASLQFSLPGKEGEPRKERHVPSHGERPRRFRVRCVVCGRSGHWIHLFREGG